MSHEVLVILSKLEQEYLLYAIEEASQVRDARQFFMWSQGPLQALVPHHVMVCLQLGTQDELQQLECLHSKVLDPDLQCRLIDRDNGLALRLARHYRQIGSLPAQLDASSCVGSRDVGQGTAAFQLEMRKLGLENMLMHGSERLQGGSTFFVLFGLPHCSRRRHAYFLQLLLPYLHISLQRINFRQSCTDTLLRPVSAREAEILHWVREGKSNEEIGLILGISAFTVKNHLQRLYRLLGVSNRAQVIARGMALQLFDRPPQLLARTP